MMSEREGQIVIRAAVGDADIGLVRALMREYGDFLESLAAQPVWAASFCLAGYDRELAGLPQPYVAPGTLLLAEVKGEVAGCVALKPLLRAGVSKEADALAERESALELKRLWVRGGFRGYGLGAKLMCAAIDYARSVGAKAVYLDTVPGVMPEANRLYEAMSFERVERYNHNPGEGTAFYRLMLGQGYLIEGGTNFSIEQ